MEFHSPRLVRIRRRVEGPIILDRAIGVEVMVGVICCYCDVAVDYYGLAGLITDEQMTLLFFIVGIL